MASMEEPGWDTPERCYGIKTFFSTANLPTTSHVNPGEAIVENFENLRTFSSPYLCEYIDLVRGQHGRCDMDTIWPIALFFCCY